MNWLALDIGGANLKIANGAGYAATRPFALWQDSSRLHEAIEALLAAAPASEAIAVTMTGELADCYVTKAEGVRHILGAVARAAADCLLRVYRNDGQFVAPAEAIADPRPIAAANWHALARFVGRFSKPGMSLLIDIGSTTTDVIPLIDCFPAAQGITDTQRLATGELVYTGIARTPLAALVSALSYRGQTCGVAREWFATTQDVYLTLDELREDETDFHTADGKPATKLAAQTRLARMICADGDLFTSQDAAEMAATIMQSQLNLVTAAVNQVLGGHPEQLQSVVISGSGEFLARRVVRIVAPHVKLLSLSQLAGVQISHCAAAHAVAVLAEEECR